LRVCTHVHACYHVLHVSTRISTRCTSLFDHVLLALNPHECFGLKHCPRCAQRLQHYKSFRLRLARLECPRIGGSIQFYDTLAGWSGMLTASALTGKLLRYT